MGYHHFGMGPFGFFGGHGFGGLLFWLLIFFVCYQIFRSSRSWRDKPNRERDALDALNNRLARGDIDAQEYDAILKRIHS